MLRFTPLNDEEYWKPKLKFASKEKCFYCGKPIAEPKQEWCEHTEEQRRNYKQTVGKDTCDICHKSIKPKRCKHFAIEEYCIKCHPKLKRIEKLNQETIDYLDAEAELIEDRQVVNNSKRINLIIEILNEMRER